MQRVHQGSHREGKVVTDTERTENTVGEAGTRSPSSIEAARQFPAAGALGRGSEPYCPLHAIEFDGVGLARSELGDVETLFIVHKQGRCSSADAGEAAREGSGGERG